MTAYENDILKPIEDENILILLEVAKKNLPATYRIHHFLWSQYKRKTFLKCPENRDVALNMSARSNFNLFTHRNGDIQNCTVVAITVEGPREHIDDYTVFAYSMQENNAELDECIKQTKRINWELGPLFLSIEYQHMPIVEDVIKERHLAMDWNLPNTCVWLPKEKALQLEYEIPDDVYLDYLKVEDSKWIDDSWYIRSVGSHDFLRTEIQLNWGIGVYKKDTNMLVAWIFINESYAVGFLTTVKSERGKGYGKLATMAFCKEFAKRENMDLVTYIIHTNTVSRNLFEGKIGFEPFSDCHWAKIKRSETVK